jgi:hypothetical protein
MRTINRGAPYGRTPVYGVTGAIIREFSMIYFYVWGMFLLGALMPGALIPGALMPGALMPGALMAPNRSRVLHDVLL